MSQTVSVRHNAARTSPATLVAALNGAMLDASLTPPRRQAQVRLSARPLLLLPPVHPGLLLSPLAHVSPLNLLSFWLLG